MAMNYQALVHQCSYALGSFGDWAAITARYAIFNVENARYNLPNNWRDCSIGIADIVNGDLNLQDIYKRAVKHFNIHLIWTGVGKTDMALAIGSFDEDYQALVPIHESMEIEDVRLQIMNVIRKMCEDFCDDTYIVCWYMNA
jgi:hypothetical protein